MQNRLVLIAIVLLAVHIPAPAAIRLVPDEYPTIQAGINACRSGDEVVVLPGTYTGPGNRDIYLPPNGIIVRSVAPHDPLIVAATIIDCNGTAWENHRAFGIGHPDNDEAPDSVIDGLTITNGYASYGGAIYCHFCSPIVRNCIIRGNIADYGGAVYCTYEGATVTDCSVTDNSADNNGGGLYMCTRVTNCVITGNTAAQGGGLYNCNRVSGCMVAGNRAQDDGGGMYCNYATVANSTFVANTAEYGAGGGLFFAEGAAPFTDYEKVLTHSVVWANRDGTEGGESAQIGGSSSYVTFSCIHDEDPGDANVPFGGQDHNNIDDYPQFIRDPDNGGDGWGDDPCTPNIDEGANDDLGDLHLTAGSPCIDKGHPDFFAGPGRLDIDGQPRVMGGRVDIGVDEFLVPSITVTNPAGGEVWTGRSVHEIRWQSYGVNGQVRISCSTDGGRKWKKIKNKADNTGTFRWRLPRKRKLNSDQCLVSVVPRRFDPDVICKPSGLFTIHQDTPGPAVRSRWSSLGGDFDRTGLSEDPGPDLGCVKWQFETTGPVSPSVTIGAADNVHIACEDGKLYTLDPDGSLLWSCDTNSPLYSAPTVGPDGSVYVGGENGRLYAINTDGQVRWTYSTGAFIYSSPAVSADGKVYVGSADGILYALGSDGSELWRFDDSRSDTPAGPIFASPAIGPDGTVYISRLHDANLYALDPTDGHMKWSCNFEHWIYDHHHEHIDTISGWPFASPVVAPDGTIYQTLLYDPNLYAIDPNTGTILWSLDLHDLPCDGEWRDERCRELLVKDLTDGWSEPVLGPDGTIYVSFNDANLRAVDPNGTIKWQTKLGSGDGFTLTVADNGLIYAAGNDGWLCAIDPNGTEIARFQGRAGLNFPVVSANNTLIVSDNANVVWAIGGNGCQGQQQVLRRPEDPDGSGIVNLRDVALLMLDWSLCTNPDQQWWLPPCDYQGEPTYLIADVDRDLYVDFRDLRMITDRWLTVDKSAFLGAQP